MAYSRREIYDFKTVITAALYNNLQDGIEELFKQISLVTETGIPKLMVFPLFEVATEESQTVFPINLSTFDEDTDTVFVHSGRTTLAPEQDYTIENNTIVLNEGVPKGRTILIYIFKNVPIGEEGSVSGSVIADKTLPLKKLAEMPTAEDVGARPNTWTPNASEVGAHPNTWMPTASDVGAIPSFNCNWREYSDIQSALKAELLNVVDDLNGKVFTAFVVSGTPYLVNAHRDGTVVSGHYTNYLREFVLFVRDNAGEWFFFDVYTEYNKPTAYDLSIPVNNNILINSNFANPVNQRGVTAETWTDMDLGFDRWAQENGDFIFPTSEKRCTTIKPKNGHTFFRIHQKFEAESYMNNILTASVKSNGNIKSATFSKKLSELNQWEYEDVYYANEGLRFRLMRSTGESATLSIYFENQTVELEWVKLELGDHATPYVPRLYSEELALCQRYYMVKRAVEASLFGVTSTTLCFNYNTGEMRVKPTVDYSGCVVNKNDVEQTGFTFETPASYNYGGITFFVHKNNHGLSETNVITLGGYIKLDAEL